MLHRVDSRGWTIKSDDRQKRSFVVHGLDRIIPDERAAADGGASAAAVAARPWEALSPRALGEEAISPRSHASHSVDGGSTRYVMTSFLLIPRCYSCRDLRRLVQIKPMSRSVNEPDYGLAAHGTCGSDSWWRAALLLRKFSTIYAYLHNVQFDTGHATGCVAVSGDRARFCDGSAAGGGAKGYTDFPTLETTTT